MDRYWLLTWTTYGTWLPGDLRGFVSNVRDGDRPEVKHNVPGTPYDADLPDLEHAARANRQGEPVYLVADQADVLIGQFRATAAYRGWQLLAAAVMANHVHLVVGVPGDPGPEKLLQDFKGYASRALNRTRAKPAGPRWWTESGSRRKLPDERAGRAAVEYVRRQRNARAVWVADEYAGEGERGA